MFSYRCTGNLKGALTDLKGLYIGQRVPDAILGHEIVQFQDCERSGEKGTLPARRERITPQNPRRAMMDEEGYVSGKLGYGAVLTS